MCLERLDTHISGIVTTVCNHTFHSACLSKWADSSCPVCRYSQEQPDEAECQVCGTTDNLWICIICGYVGCGRRVLRSTRRSFCCCFASSPHCAKTADVQVCGRACRVALARDGPLLQPRARHAARVGLPGRRIRAPTDCIQDARPPGGAVASGAHLSSCFTHAARLLRER